MSKIGFLFKIDNKLEIVFTKNNKLKSDIVIGFEKKISENTQSYYLDSKLNIKEHKVLGEISYCKISLSNRTQKDFDNNMLWLSSDLYKQIRFLLTNATSREEIIRNTIEIFEILF